MGQPASKVPEASETFQRAADDEVEDERPRRRSILEMLEDDGGRGGPFASPAQDADGEESEDRGVRSTNTDVRPTDTGAVAEGHTGAGAGGSEAAAPRPRSFRDPDSLKGSAVRESDEPPSASRDEPATRRASRQAGRSVPGGAGQASRTGAEGEASPTSADGGEPPGRAVGEGAPATAAGNGSATGLDRTAHPVADEPAQAEVDQLVPEWIGKTEQHQEKGFLGRLLDGLMGRSDPAPDLAEGSTEGGSASSVAAERTGPPVEGGPGVAEDTDPDVRVAADSDVRAATDSDVRAAADPDVREAADPDVRAATDSDVGDAARTTIRRMIRERDRELVEAKRDSARLYELAASVDEFVDEILVAARER